MSTEPSSGSDRKQPQKEVQGREMWRWGEKRPRRSCADRGTAGNRHLSEALCQPAHPRRSHSLCAGWQRARRVQRAQEGFRSRETIAQQHPRRRWHARDGSRRQAAALLPGQLERSHLCPASTMLLAQRGWTYTAMKKQQQSPHGTSDGFQGLLCHATMGLTFSDLQKYVKETGSAET